MNHDLGEAVRRGSAQLLARLRAQGLAAQVIRNSGWLVAERLLRMGVAFVLTIWTVRYLGPSDYGLLAYGLSVVMILDVVATLGLRNIVVKELVEDPHREREIVGTAIGVKLGTALVAGVATVGVVWVVDPDSSALPVIAVLALGLPFSAFSAMDLSFQATLQSQYGVIARVAGLAAASALRIVLLVTGGPLIGFAIASGLEFATSGLGFVFIYRRMHGPLGLLRFRLSTARHLLVASWPLFVSALAASVYLKIDQVMLQAFAGAREVGVYAAAARLSEIWYFIPVVTSSSLLPMLVMRRLEGPEAYRASLQRSFDVILWIAIALSLGITLIVAPTVSILYGAGFEETDDILRIHTWAAPFIFMGTVLGRALIAEDRQRFELTRHIAGALLNVILNLTLIPTLGAPGAAIATVASYATASYVICFITPPLRLHARLMTRAFLWPLRAARGPLPDVVPVGVSPGAPGPSERFMTPRAGGERIVAQARVRRSEGGDHGSKGHLEPRGELVASTGVVATQSTHDDEARYEESRYEENEREP